MESGLPAVTGAGGWATGITLPVALVVLGLVVLLAMALAAAVVEARRRRQVRALLGRLGELEDRLDEPSASSRPSVEQTPPPRAAGHSDSSSDPLAGLTTHVQRLVQGASDFEAANLADQAIAVVHRHLEESFTPRALADELHVSIRTLERGLAHVLSCTPGQLITAMKMRQARQMLASGRYRVTEVATRLAFSSPQYFSRRFKAFYGCSPSRIQPPS